MLGQSYFDTSQYFYEIRDDVLNIVRFFSDRLSSRTINDLNTQKEETPQPHSMAWVVIK